MIKLINIAFCSALFFVVPIERNTDNLFLQWNRATLGFLNSNCPLLEDTGDRKRCQQLHDDMLPFWSTDTVNIYRQSFRWRFLNKIVNEENLSNDWIIVEVKKSGERTRFMNYLITQNGSKTKVVIYDYIKGEWIKLGERTSKIKLDELRIPLRRMVVPTNSSGYEIIITNFKKDSVLKSQYCLPYFIPLKNKVIKLLDGQI